MVNCGAVDHRKPRGPSNKRSTVRRTVDRQPLRWLLAVLPALAGCGNLEYEGFLNRPVAITLQEDVPLVQLRFQGGAEFSATLDSGTPITVIELSPAASAIAAVIAGRPGSPPGTIDPRGSGHRVRGELRLEDARPPRVTRFIFKDLEVFDVSPRLVGLDQGLPIRGIVGFSLLRNFVVRLSFAAGGSVVFKDEIPDSKEELASDCDPALLLRPIGTRPSCIGVWNAVPYGGGLVEMGGDSLELEGTRLVMPLCLLPDEFDQTRPDELGPQQPSGVPATAVVTTGQGVSIMSRSLLDRLHAAGAKVVEEPAVKLNLPYGTERANLVSIERIAAVSDETIELGACSELARRRRLLVAGRAGVVPFDQDRDGASVALVRRAVTFAVIDDTRPLIQGLRQELSPFVGDVDMVLGGNFLRHFEVDLDYPGKRVILQCSQNQALGACEVLPFCSSANPPRCPGKTQQ